MIGTPALARVACCAANQSFGFPPVADFACGGGTLEGSTCSLQARKAHALFQGMSSFCPEFGCACHVAALQFGTDLQRVPFGGCDIEVAKLGGGKPLDSCGCAGLHRGGRAASKRHQYKKYRRNPLHDFLPAGSGYQEFAPRAFIWQRGPGVREKNRAGHSSRRVARLMDGPDSRKARPTQAPASTPHSAAPRVPRLCRDCPSAPPAPPARSSHCRRQIAPSDWCHSPLPG